MTRPQQKRNNRLRNARRAAGLTQGQLADRIGTSEKSVQRWEAGKVTPHPYVLDALCRELHVENPEELGFGDLEEAPPEEEDQPVLQQTEQKPSREKQRQKTFPLQVPPMKRISLPPLRRNFYLMIGIISTLVVVTLVGRVVMAAFFDLPLLRPTPISGSDCGQPFSGMFHGHQLDARWHWDNPTKRAVWSLDPQCSLSITASLGSDLNPNPDYSHNLKAPRLLQSLPGDFTIQAHLQFHPTKNFQSAGLLFWQEDEHTFLRFERFFGSQDEGILLQKDDNNKFSKNLATNYLTSAQSFDLQMQKQGDFFTASWREPGHAWQTEKPIKLHFDHLEVGFDVLALYNASQTTATFTSFTVSRA